MKKIIKIVLLIYAFLAYGIGFAQQSWQYNFFEGQEIKYAFEARPSTLVINLDRVTLFSTKGDLVGQFCEKVEKQISSDSYQIYVRFDFLKINGLPPTNYHPQCNRVLVRTNGLLLQSEIAGHSWFEYKKSNSFFSLAEYQSPNFGYQLPGSKIVSETPFFLIESPNYIINDAIILVFPKIEDELAKINYLFLGSDSNERVSILYSGFGQIVLSLKTGLLLSNESKFLTLLKSGKGFASCFNANFFPYTLKMINKE